MEQKGCKNCGGSIYICDAVCDDYGNVMYYNDDRDFCSSTCEKAYPEKKKREHEDFERRWKKEREEREKKSKYDFPKCVWCGKTYCRLESTAINKGVCCCRKCEFEYKQSVNSKK